MNSFDFFDRIYCINLPESTERRVKVSRQFKSMGILDRVRWISAPRPPTTFECNVYHRHPPGEMGCSLSHITAVVDAISEGAENALFLEDDITFIPKAANRLKAALKELPDEWSGLYLGCGLAAKAPPRVSDHLSIPRVGQLEGTYGYAVNGHCLIDYFKYWTYGITHGVTWNDLSPIDAILARFLGEQDDPCFVITPQIIETVRGGADSLIGSKGTK